jgi:hypothetical protein
MNLRTTLLASAVCLAFAPAVHAGGDGCTMGKDKASQASTTQAGEPVLVAGAAAAGGGGTGATEDRSGSGAPVGNDEPTKRGMQDGASSSGGSSAGDSGSSSGAGSASGGSDASGGAGSGSSGTSERGDYGSSGSGSTSGDAATNSPNRAGSGSPSQR